MNRKENNSKYRALSSKCLCLFLFHNKNIPVVFILDESKLLGARKWFGAQTILMTHWKIERFNDVWEFVWFYQYVNRNFIGHLCQTHTKLAANDATSQSCLHSLF